MFRNELFLFEIIGEYRKAMLQSAHIIVINSKNLLDSIDQVRLRLMTSSQSSSPKRSLLSQAVEEETEETENSLSVSPTSLDIN
jgi:hypothetical protein